MMSAEAFVKYASRCYNKEFGKFKKQSNFIRTIIAPKSVPPSIDKHYHYDSGTTHFTNRSGSVLIGILIN